MSNFLGRSDFNIGQDISITIQSSNGNLYSAEQLGHLVDIDVDSEDEIIRVKPCSNGGMVMRMSVPQGIKGKIVFARTNNALEQEIINANALWYSSKIATYYTIGIMIQNRDGSTNSYTIFNAVRGPGKILGGKADKEVDQEFHFEASDIEF